MRMEKQMLQSYLTKTKSSNRASQLNTGTVKMFNRSRGFGFIRPDDGSADLFFHASALTVGQSARIQAGDRLSFERGVNPKSGRPAAVECRLAS